MPNLRLKNVPDTIVSLLSNTATAIRQWILPDKDGTIAMTDDIVQLGETSATAYRGDRGKTAFDHTSLTNNPHSVTAAQVGASTPADLSTLQSTLQINIDAKLDKKVGTVDVTDNVTLALTDIYKKLKVNAVTAKTITIPLQATVAFEAGMWFIVEWEGVGQPAIAPVSGSVTITSSSGGLTVPVRYGVMYVEYLGSNAWRAQNGGLPVGNLATLTFLNTFSGVATSTNQGSGEQFFPAGAGIIYKFDATNYNYIRAGIRLTTAGATNARCYPAYDTDLATLSFTTIGDGTVASNNAIAYSSGNVSSNTGYHETAWISLPAGAKADVYFSMREIGGDSVADPAYTVGYLQFKV